MILTSLALGKSTFLESVHLLIPVLRTPEPEENKNDFIYDPPLKPYLDKSAMSANNSVDDQFARYPLYIYRLTPIMLMLAQFCPSIRTCLSSRMLGALQE